MSEDMDMLLPDLNWKKGNPPLGEKVVAKVETSYGEVILYITCWRESFSPVVGWTCWEDQ